jgi:hypothetical protein
MGDMLLEKLRAHDLVMYRVSCPLNLANSGVTRYPGQLPESGGILGSDGPSARDDLWLG